MTKDFKFKVGDRVYYPDYGVGTVIANHNDGRPYPTNVKWDYSPWRWDVSTFTKDGVAAVNTIEDSDGHCPKLILAKDMPPEEKVDQKGNEEMTEESKFKAGDKVRSRELGIGVVEDIEDSEPTYPLMVKWVEGSFSDGAYSSFTLEGHYYNDCADEEKDITLLEGEDTVEEDKIKADAIEEKNSWIYAKK